MPYPFSGYKKKKKTAVYQITGIDLDTWKLFGAKCRMNGVTMKEALLGLIDKYIR